MKKLRLFLSFSVFVLIFIFASCSKFDKIVKSSDWKMKYEKAIYYYEKQNYTNALTLFEELIPIVKGTEKAEEAYYYYAYCNYHLGDFGLAAYHFKMYVRNFPNSKHAEECAFLNASCYYLNSPRYCLDQEDTKTAIYELQEFINTFPESTKIDTCNKIMDELRGKLERKAYEITKQYYSNEAYADQWKAAISSSASFLKEFPNSDKCEEIHFINLKSNYLLAKNSILQKKEERLNNTLESYLKFVDLYPQSKRIDDAERIYKETKKLSEELNSQKNGL